ncbi:nitrate reductase molybdenum cofactor assembly chaperone [Basilea psittacipulmonis]|uniref:Nitrate reductase n=1 Tax=Basilea psittacipulmonis DSM 24701 TaxID=1072685 RepID=A0A077DDX3_9BURK|nr:nitrate reductase molybdenum cofactor assembly chaperone [Basilea psittacipulmonis]AIL32824.1 nitrate reductase [Basilea psittacipulmonis DSM 24701]
MAILEFKCLSAMLCYPEQSLIDSLDEIKGYLLQSQYIKDTSKLNVFFDYMRSHDLITLQEKYVATFDNNRKHALYIFEHVYGEDRDRGSAMVDLLEEYRKNGFELGDDELPDYLPVLLEFLSQVDTDKSFRLLGDAVHVIEHIRSKLADSQSPYECILETLVALSPVKPQPLIEPPVRDMDEAMEMFGPDFSGVEPLLNKPQQEIVKFFPKAAYEATKGALR